MVDKEKWEQRLAENSLTILVGIFLLAVVAALVVVGIYWHYFNALPVKVDAAPWGQLGDFFGGTLNPIFGFLSVMALLSALVIQGRELRISSQELKNSALALDKQNKAIAHQSFEQTFFSWLQSYREMLDSIKFVPSFGGLGAQNRGDFSGRGLLQKWWTESLTNNLVIKKICDLENVDFPAESHFSLSQFEKESPGVIANEVGASWEKVYLSNEYQLDSLFRNLYRLILWIDSQDESRTNQEQKWMYVSIVRAQLSWIEMVYLFYNGQTDRGLKFKRLVDKYALFDNLNFESDAVINHLKEYPLVKRGYALTAYDSRLARIALGLPESTEETLAIAVV